MTPPPALLGIEIVVFALGCYRLWRYIGEDTFPPLKRPRDWFLRRWGPKSWKTEGLLCPWCSGNWITFAVVAVASQVVNVPWPVVQAFAVSTLVGFLGQLDGETS